MNPYAGNPDSFPGTIPLPDDSDPPQAATFNPGPQGNADRTAALAAGYATELADLGALAAINTALTPNGAWRTVKTLGRYQLDKTINPTFTEDRPAVVAPTAGTGRWFARDIAKINYRKIFTALATAWTCPPNITQMSVEMAGAGGGGGGGASSGSSGTDSPGGGGGAAAKKSTQDWSPTPAHTYTIGAGQAANAAAAAMAGGDGGNSGIVDPSGPTTLLLSLGGQGGEPGTVLLATVGGGKGVYVPGGTGSFGDPKTGGYSTTDLIPPRLHRQDGGFSANSVVGSSSAGAGSIEGGSGGAAGARGTNNTQIAGGGGGGGGGGPFIGANGGAGGHGGDGTASGVGHDGVAGVDAGGTNYGAGGGGGGGAGAGSSGSSTGGPGGKGAGGIVILIGVA